MGDTSEQAYTGLYAVYIAMGEPDAAASILKQVQNQPAANMDKLQNQLYEIADVIESAGGEKAVSICAVFDEAVSENTAASVETGEAGQSEAAASQMEETSASRISNHNNVFLLLNELAGCQFVKEHRRNRGIQLAGIEIVQRFLYRKSGSLQSSSGLVFLSGGCFRCHKRQKQIAKIHIRRVIAENIFVFSKSGNLQLLCKKPNLFFFHINHEAAPFRSYSLSYWLRSTDKTGTSFFAIDVSRFGRSRCITAK